MSLIEDLQQKEYNCTKCGANIDVSKFTNNRTMFKCKVCKKELVYEKEQENKLFIGVCENDNVRFYKKGAKLILVDGIKDEVVK